MRQQSDFAKSALWTELLIASDRDYFAAGAILRPVPGGRLALMPGARHAQAGAVLLLDDPRPALCDARGWHDTLARACAAAGVERIRFYTAAADDDLARALAGAGFRRSTEVAMAAPAAAIAAGKPPDARQWTFRAVTSALLWRAKRALHERTPERPDGKAIDAAAWALLEQGKVDAGYMSAWLIESRGTPVGSFGLSRSGELARFKNIFVVPEERGRGAASAAVRWVARRALDQQLAAIGCFVLPGENGERLYRRLGLVAVGRQWEWTSAVSSRAASVLPVFRRAVG